MIFIIWMGRGRRPLLSKSKQQRPMAIRMTREHATAHLLVYLAHGTSGDALPVHTTSHPAVLTVLRGRVQYEETPGTGPVELAETESVLIPANTPHTATLLADAVFQLVLPAEAKLAKQ